MRSAQAIRLFTQARYFGGVNSCGSITKVIDRGTPGLHLCECAKALPMSILPPRHNSSGQKDAGGFRLHSADPLFDRLRVDRPSGLSKAAFLEARVRRTMRRLPLCYFAG